MDHPIVPVVKELERVSINVDVMSKYIKKTLQYLQKREAKFELVKWEVIGKPFSVVEYGKGYRESFCVDLIFNIETFLKAALSKETLNNIASNIQIDLYKLLNSKSRKRYIGVLTYIKYTTTQLVIRIICEGHIK